MGMSVHQNARNEISKLPQFVTTGLGKLRFPSVQHFMMVGRQERLESVSQVLLRVQDLFPIPSVLVVEVVDQFFGQ
jgi:hypothetical protein